MSLDKGIEYGKERRRPKYNGTKRFDHSCRTGGNCDRCRSGRQYNGKRRELSSIEKLEDYNYNS